MISLVWVGFAKLKHFTCIRLPILLQRTFELCTCVSIDRLLRNLVTPIVTITRQIPDYWISSNCIRVEFCIRSPDANHIVGYNWDFAQICWNHLNIRQILRRQCNRDERLCRCVVAFVRRLRFDWRSIGDRDRIWFWNWRKEETNYIGIVFREDSVSIDDTDLSELDGSVKPSTVIDGCDAWKVSPTRVFNS